MLRRPKSVTFSEGVKKAFELRPDTIVELEMDQGQWSRVIFQIPDVFNSFKAVNKWLDENTTDKYISYHFSKNETVDSWPSYESFMVVKFKSRDDAMTFKLEDGHKAYERLDEQDFI